MRLRRSGANAGLQTTQLAGQFKIVSLSGSLPSSSTLKIDRCETESLS